MSPWQLNVKENPWEEKGIHLMWWELTHQLCHLKHIIIAKLCWHILTIQNDDLLLSSYHPFINKTFVKLLLISNIRIYKLPSSPWIVWEGNKDGKGKDAFSWGNGQCQVYTLIPCFFIKKRERKPSTVNIRVNKFSFISYELLIHLPESSAVPGWLFTWGSLSPVFSWWFMLEIKVWILSWYSYRNYATKSFKWFSSCQFGYKHCPHTSLFTMPPQSTPSVPLWPAPPL